MDKNFNLDHYALRILDVLQRDARATVQQIADEVGLSATPCWKRIKDMEAAGVIRGYTALVDREAVGLQMQVLAEVNLSSHNADVVAQFERMVHSTPAIVRALSTTGQGDYMLWVMVPDIAAYEQLLHGTLFKLAGVSNVRSAIVMREVKSSLQLPIPTVGMGAAPVTSPARTPRAKSKNTRTT